MKRIISLLLSIVTVLGLFALVACAKDNDQGGSDGPAPTPEDFTHPLMEAGLDFDGYHVTFALSSADVDGSNGRISCDVEEKTGDTVVDAIYDRNQLVEQTLNVVIEPVLYTNHTKFTEGVLPSLLSQTDDYNILWGQQANDIDLCLEGYVLDLNKLSDDQNYINYEEDWWATQYINYYKYDNELFWLSSPLSLIYLGGASCTLVNKRIYDANFEAIYGNIYDYVREGKWTIDDMVAMSNTIHNDANNNNKIDEGDVIGSAFQSSWTIMQLLVGVGLECSVRNADGSITFGVTKDNRKYVDTVQKTFNLFESAPGIDNSIQWKNYFAEGNQLFNITSISDLGGAKIREMTDDFYLIPNPKLDVNQAAYRSAMSDGNQIMGISWTCQNIPASTATLELMAYASKQMVEDVYYEEALKYKFSRDDDTPEMIELVHNSVYVDFVLIWERYLFDTHWIRYSGYKNNIASQISKVQDKWIKFFNETVEKLKGVGADA